MIDEYDKPILDNITKHELAQDMRSCLRDFYSVLKAQDENLRFVMLTGITKFSKVPVFSGLNNLEDISRLHAFSTLLGYTQTEFETAFAPWIKNLAEKQATSVDAQIQKINVAQASIL